MAVVVVAGLAAVVTTGGGCTALVSFDDHGVGADDAAGAGHAAFTDASGGFVMSHGDDDAGDDAADATTAMAGDAASSGTPPDASSDGAGVTQDSATVDAGCGIAILPAPSTSQPLGGDCFCTASTPTWRCADEPDAGNACNVVPIGSSSAPSTSAFECGGTPSSLTYTKCDHGCVESTLGAVCNPCFGRSDGYVCQNLPTDDNRYLFIAARVKCLGGAPSSDADGIVGCGTANCCSCQ